MNNYSRFAVVLVSCGALGLTGCGSKDEASADAAPTPKTIIVVATPTPGAGSSSNVTSPAADTSSTSSTTTEISPGEAYFNAYKKCMDTVLEAENKFKTGTTKADLSEAKAILDQADRDFMFVVAPAEFTKADSLVREGISLDRSAFMLAQLAIETHTSGDDGKEKFVQAGEVFHRANDEMKRVLESLKAR